MSLRSVHPYATAEDAHLRKYARFVLRFSRKLGLNLSAVLMLDSCVRVTILRAHRERFSVEVAAKLDRHEER